MQKEINNRRLYYIFIFYRVCLSVLSTKVIIKFTTLGDYDRYINADFKTVLQGFAVNRLLESTYLTDLIVSTLMYIFRYDVIVNFIVCFIITHFVFLLYEKINLNGYIGLFILFLPTFNIWSSYASKDTLGVLFVCMFLINAADILQKGKANYACLALSLLLIYIFKVQYIPSLIIILIYLIINGKTSEMSKVLYGYLGFVLIVVLFFILKDVINEVAIRMPTHFSTDARSTRDSAILTDSYGIFKNMLYGMFIAFWGPTVEEMQTSFLHFFTFFESLLLLIAITYEFIKGWAFKKKIGSLIFVLIAIFLLLFAHYPFGVLNPGAAIRYRTNLYLILVFLIKMSELTAIGKKEKGYENIACNKCSYIGRS